MNPPKKLPVRNWLELFQTVFFWAPFWKWTLVIAGIADFARPASTISKNNSMSLILNGTLGMVYWFFKFSFWNELSAKHQKLLDSIGLLYLETLREWLVQSFLLLWDSFKLFVLFITSKLYWLLINLSNQLSHLSKLKNKNMFTKNLMMRNSHRNSDLKVRSHSLFRC